MTRYSVIQGEGGEILVLPSVTPNPSQFRVGVRIGERTIWLRKIYVQELIQALKEELK